MRQRATVGSLLPDGSVSLLVQRVSACTGDCGHCGGCGACAMAGKCHGGSGCGGSALRDVKNLKHQNT